MSWADPDARLAEFAGLPDHGRLVALPLLSAEELLRLRWAVQLGMATVVEQGHYRTERPLGHRMLTVLASLDTALAGALHEAVQAPIEERE